MENAAKFSNTSSTTISGKGSVISDKRRPIAPVADIRPSDLSGPALLGMFLGWEDQFGDAGVRTALHATADNSTSTLLWANQKLPSDLSDAGTYYYFTTRV